MSVLCSVITYLLHLLHLLNLLQFTFQRATYYNQSELSKRHDEGLTVDPPLIVVSMKDYEDVAVRTQTNPTLQKAVREELVQVRGTEI